MGKLLETITLPWSGILRRPDMEDQSVSWNVLISTYITLLLYGSPLIPSRFRVTAPPLAKTKECEKERKKSARKRKQIKHARKRDIGY